MEANMSAEASTTLRYLAIRTTAFLALTTLSTGLMALPYLGAAG
jgi:hypothetical protein